MVEGRNKGPEGFQHQYEEWYGDRWTKLRAKLLEPAAKVSMLNPFALTHSSRRSSDPELALFPIALERAKNAAPIADFESASELAQDEGSKRLVENSLLAASYELDLASVAAALALPLSDGCRWLDVCAAPGGKSLVQIFAHQGNLETTANELSPQRSARLRAVFHDFLPPEILARVHFTRRNGERWLQRGDLFAGVLVDAPCSGERHLLQRPSELSHWSLKRSQGLAIRQHTLLCSMLEAVEVGGHILYSTCSLSPLENDKVIEKFLDRRSGRVDMVEAKVWLGRRSRYGVEIHPDQTGFGPIYYALLKRTH